MGEWEHGKISNQELQTIQDYKMASDQVIKNYCANNDIDIKAIHPLQWDDIMCEIGKQVIFPNMDYFRTESKQYNEFDVLKVYCMFTDVFRPLNLMYKQTITLYNFTNMLCTNKQTIYNITKDRLIKAIDKYIYNINNNVLNVDNSILLTCYTFDFGKNNLGELIAENAENSYVKALEGSTQYMRYLPILNKKYGYNMPGTKDQVASKQALTSENLPKLGQNSGDTVQYLPNKQ